ncbi:TetR/AcrR family transcriptional regulator [Stappia sp. F7233]|uniref:TetR/AcrR family transcriptional regulator n=1 Tax=Stappia albiluteola TaxID=2758565 RepID=A0A839AGN1_9HYPH|nr:TetR/AcrR family transcriptional regulator [Stappia albiluteola]MBA5778831.1 TetR/AcrR family transcriptional regulator [Stappia albiluteola]
MTQKARIQTKSDRRSLTREKIIDAAIEVVAEQGARRFSLDAVADRAGVSKGGLLYNFPSKSDLMKAMVARHVDGFSAQLEQTLAVLQGDGRPNAFARAYLSTFRDHICQKGRPPAGFLAAIAEEPGLLDPVREKNAAYLAEIRSTSENANLAMMGFLAVEGIRHMRLFDTSPLELEELLTVVDGLLARLAEDARAG